MVLFQVETIHCGFLLHVCIYLAAFNLGIVIGWRGSTARINLSGLLKRSAHDTLTQQHLFIVTIHTIKLALDHADTRTKLTI